MAFGSKNSTPSFVLTLPMVIGLNEQDYLNKEFKKCGIIYNQLVNATTKMWHQLRKTRKYRELMAAIAKAAPDSDEQKALFKQREKTLNSAFPAFLEMHENTKRRLQAVGSSLPASIGF